MKSLATGSPMEHSVNEVLKQVIFCYPSISNEKGLSDFRRALAEVLFPYLYVIIVSLARLSYVHAHTERAEIIPHHATIFLACEAQNHEAS